MAWSPPPPLTPAPSPRLPARRSPLLSQQILALKACHRDNPFAKYWGVCNEAAKALNLCFKGEKAAKR